MGSRARPGAPSPLPELKCVGRAGTGGARWARASAPLRGTAVFSPAALAQHGPPPPPEPDNEAHLRSAARPCSPAHHHEGHAKLASGPARASPVRMGPSYVLKKGSQGRAGGRVSGASPRGAWG